MSTAVQCESIQAARPACLSKNPHRLVSLLDVMRMFAATDLLRISRDLGNNASLVFEPKSGPGFRLAAVDKLAATILQCRELAVQNDLPMVALHASQLLNSIALNRELLNTSGAERMATMLCVTLENEISLRMFLAIPHESKAYFDSPRCGWEQVIDRFPDAVSDIEEMSRCYALSRYTASVFHSVQVIEHGLVAVGEWLGIRDPQSGWTAVSNKLKTITSSKYSDRSPLERDHFNFIEQLHGTVEALKNAWRNKISHATGRIKMGTDFIPDVAQEIIMASRALMRRLATDLPRETMPS
jgi:hypothetical protein